MSTDTIRTSMIADPNSFNPLEAQGSSAAYVDALLYGTLLSQDPAGSLVGNLATDWDVTPEKGVFTIREGATCSDGTEITPTVVADSLEAFIDESRNKQIVFGPSDPELTADDEAGTITIELEVPWADMVHGLTLPETGIICPAGLENPEQLAAGEVDGAYSGPYTLDNFQPGVTIDFSLREEYEWPEYETPLEGVPATTIKYAINSDYNSVANGLLTGTIDVSHITGEPMERFDGKDDFHTERYPAAVQFIMFNEREGTPFADEENRRAVAQALDREAFNQAATNGNGELLTSFVPQEVQCALTDDSLLLPQDADSAQATLEGEAIRQIGTQAVGPNGAGNSYVSQALEEVGANVDLRNVDNTTWTTDLHSNPESWDITVSALLNQSRTMYGGLSQFTGPAPEDGGRNSTGSEKTEVLERVSEAQAEPDEEKRCEIYQEIQQGLIDSAHFVPLSTLAAQATAAEGFSVQVVNGGIQPTTMRITK
ncbi:ABC transporter substrate-binding protein [Enteractinococcus fodinae]|uniref:Peptide/nickel transport system substrate-binding protein n=1 Tax=Enteractinococcus fodinae TaxID=684663 RepID=A0ABU2B483_9MICC|nr:ABC transporter substrate-binding protein [Enteractinococcus fodinae]MDR7348415.1 peptide/nickel transport system substrate-binding protein [Enteractinococcus fodinae]